MNTLNKIGLFALLVLFSCETGDLVQSEDYSQYLEGEPNEKLENLEEQIIFWQEKESANPSNTYKFQLAGLYETKFKLSGKVQYLKEAETLLEELDARMAENKAGLYRSLASTAISQHEFEKAYEYASKASKIRDKQYASMLVLYDACMELAYYDQAEAILNELEDKNSFDYKVRYAKWLDFIGELDQAVKLMEESLLSISPSKTDLKLWTLSNLGDMYGHQGEIEKAYSSYLDVLAIDPHYYYALKGIAYIAFSHDKNTAKAKEILYYLQEAHPVPDYTLMLADIADFEEDAAQSSSLKSAFIKEVGEPFYGNMYNTYLLELHLDALQFDDALGIAQQELERRATPQTYDLLAWAYYKQGQKALALEIAQEHVEGRSYEPSIMYHLGVIYQEQDKKKSKAYLEEAAMASFELGPNTSRNLSILIAQI